MPASARRLIEHMIEDLKTERDELALQVHFGKQEVKNQLYELSDQLESLSRRYEPLKDAVEETGEETGEDVWDALRLVADEIKDGYRRIRQSIP